MNWSGTNYLKDMPKENRNRILEIARSNKWTWAIVTNNHFIVIDEL